MNKASKPIKLLVILTALMMFIVLIAGSVVTKTGSGLGCGHDWPLCHGQFVPAFTIKTALEYSHRFVSGLVGILVLASFIVVLVKYRKRKDIVLYASIALFFTVLQALLGAAAVVWGQSPLVLAFHFGFSLFAFAGTLLTAITVSRVDKPMATNGWGEAFPADYRVTPTFKRIVWGTLIYSYVVVYLGAYVRHTNAMAGCTGWPTCDGKLVPDHFDAITTAAYTHRVGAGLFLVCVLVLSHFAYRHYYAIKVVRWTGLGILVTTLAQIFSGAWIVETLDDEAQYLYAALTHSTIISIVFGLLCYLSVLVWQLGGKADVPKS
jgi:cytochrome c oxidase assembly protein subunit 15